MLATLAWQVKTEDWLGGYVPHPARWLAEERWDDEPMAPPLTRTNARAIAVFFGDAPDF